MTSTTSNDFKLSLRNVLKRYHDALALVVFLVGLILRGLAVLFTGIGWQLVGDFGTFIAGAVAIPFIYDRFIKVEDRKLFLSDLEEILDAKIARDERGQHQVKVYGEGRLSIGDKVAFFNDARKEVIESGIALSSFARYFEQRPYHEFKKPVIEMLARGVNIRCVALDPDSEIAKNYALDRNEAGLIRKVQQAKERLCDLRSEFEQKGLAGKFEIYNYAHYPLCYVLMVDPTEPSGRAHVSHYMHGLKRADSPVLEIHKSSNPELFEKYHAMVNQLITQSTLVP